MRACLDDLRYGLRSMRRSRGFAAIAVLILAVGIGGNTAIFSVLRQAFLVAPPFPDPDRLVAVDLTLRRGSGEPRDRAWSYPKYEVFQASARYFEDLAIYRARSMTMSGTDDPERLSVELVSPAYFSILGVDAAIGRTFVPEEGAPTAGASVVVLGHDLWVERFGADVDVVGQDITLNGKSLSVVGVLPPRFEGITGRARAWVPMAGSPLISRNFLTSEQVHWVRIIGRLVADVPISRAEADAEAAGRAMTEAIPPGVEGDVESVRLVPLRAAWQNDRTRTSVALLAAAVALVLLVSCANVAGLVVARGSARQRELAVRAAVGAERGRLVRQLVGESLMLGLAGGTLGILFAVWGIDAIAGALPHALGVGGTRGLRFLDPSAIRLDPAVLLFGIGLALSAGALAGIAPALRLSRPDLAWALREGARSTGHGLVTGRALRLRGMLVVAQVAVALVLVVGAGLMVQTLMRLHAVELGMEPDRMLVFSYEFTGASPAVAQPSAFHEALLTRLRSLPDVEHATIGCPPLGPCEITQVAAIEGRPPFEEGTWPLVEFDQVGDGHFRALGGSLLRGRDFGPGDRRGAPLAVILNETAASELFPGEEALGRRLSLGIGDFYEQFAEVVGIVGDVLHGRFEDLPEPHVYLPFRQEPATYATVMLRTNGPPEALIGAVRSEVSTLDPNLAISDVSTVRERIGTSTARTRVIVVLLSAFAIAALILTAVGLYGVIAFAVSLRTREFGLRAAVGAAQVDLLRLVVREGMVLGAIGTAAGLVCALVASRALRALVFDVATTDPLTLVGAGAFVLAVTALASFIPALQAARVDPMVALRQG